MKEKIILKSANPEQYGDLIIECIVIENDKIGDYLETIPESKKIVGYKTGMVIAQKGQVGEKIVTNKTRSKGIGQLLINKMEEYFKQQECEYILVDVFAYNDIAIKFYNQKDYHSRMHSMIKKI